MNEDCPVEEFLTPEEVARELKLGVLTIYKYIRSHKLRAVRFGRTYRVSKNDLKEFIDKNKTF